MGAVFTPTKFLDLGGRRAVDVVLHRLAKAGTIRRLTRGLITVNGSNRQPHCEGCADVFLTRHFNRAAVRRDYRLTDGEAQTGVDRARA